MSNNVIFAFQIVNKFENTQTDRHTHIEVLATSRTISRPRQSTQSLVVATKAISFDAS